MTVLAVVPWPWLQDHAHEFYVIKGLLALLATVLVVWHMADTWGTVVHWSQRLRYLALLALIGVSTYAAPEQLADGIPVSTRNVLGGLAVVLVIVAMVASIVHDRRHR